MRLVLANPHYYIYGKTVVNVLLRRKHFLKYQYFLEYYVKNPTKKTAFFIDGTKTSLAAIGISFPLFSKFFVYIELLFWMLLNGINPFRVPVYFNIDTLHPKTDVMVNFSRSANTKKASKKEKKFGGLEFAFFTHYFLGIQKIVAYAQALPHLIPVAENNLVNNAYFRKFFPFIQTVYQLPFSFAERFIAYIEFSKRRNKCFAIGTICPVEKTNTEYLSYFQLDTLHPMRETIYDRREEIVSEIDSYIRPYKSFVTVREVDPEDSSLIRWMKKWGPAVLLKMLLMRKHNQYFKFDIVQKYNEYKMFVSPEESIGLPSINAFEGMACGSAFIGIDDPMYTNLGLIPGIHYISYQKDDFNDLIAKIRYYQERPEELEQIAGAGKQFVETNFNKQRIASTLWRDLEAMSVHFATTGEIKVKCGFWKDSL